MTATILALPNYSEANDDVKKKVEAFITASVNAYQSGKHQVHMAAVLGVMWAAKYGDARFLTQLYNELNKGATEKELADAINLRAWTRLVSTYTGSNGKEGQWLGFTSKATEKKPFGFYVKSGHVDFQTAREAMDEEALKRGPRFMDRIAGGGNPMTIARIFEELAKLNKKVGKQEEKAAEESPSNYIPLPDSFKAALNAISAEAASELAKLTAATPAAGNA